MQRNILEYLEHTQAAFPDKIAFADDADQWSFSKLLEVSRAIGTRLLEGGYRNEAVLVYMDKSPAAIGAFFGAVYAGCFYVPLDEEMSRRRLELILENTQARILICDESTLGAAQSLPFSGELLPVREAAGTAPSEELLSEIRRNALDTDPVYLLYTSGSTGVPKGVIGHHRGLIDYTDALGAVLRTDEDTVFGNQAPLYFDASMKEIYLTIRSGATTWLLAKSLFLFPIKLVNYLNEHRINTICWVVSALTTISSFGTFEEVVPEHLRLVTFVGEVFPVAQFNLWKKALPDTRFVNLYGPTECTGVCCYYEADRFFAEDEAIPVGRPFPNMGLLVLGEDGQPVSGEEEGELYIRGSGVTHGYYRDPERTAQSFVQNPLHMDYPETVYRTGDIVRRNAHGELIFVSRRDHQIKHMGHRIELGEIEANVAAVAGVRDCCCIYSKADNKLVLYYEGEPDVRALTKELKGRLPRYMLPNRSFWMESLPYTATGKHDRPALEAEYRNRN